MTRRLTAVEWENVCEHADGRRAAGAMWHEIAEEAAAAGVCEEDLEQLEAMHRKWARREQRRASNGVELNGDTAAPESEGSLSFSPAHEDTRRAVQHICGDGLLTAKWVWKGTVNRTLKKGDRVEVFKGPRPGWRVCAVVIHHEDGTREVLAEHRVRQRLKAGVARTKGETLRMQVLELEEGLNTKGIVRRVAATTFGYYGEQSGIRSASHLAKVSGVKRQAVHAGQLKLRADHEALTGDAACEGLAGRCPKRRPGKKGKPANRGDVTARRSLAPPKKRNSNGGD